MIIIQKAADAPGQWSRRPTKTAMIGDIIFHLQTNTLLFTVYSEDMRIVSLAFILFEYYWKYHCLYWIWIYRRQTLQTHDYITVFTNEFAKYSNSLAIRPPSGNITNPEYTRIQESNAVGPLKKWNIACHTFCVSIWYTYQIGLP